MRRQLVVGLDGLPSELLAWCFGLVLAHLPMVARPGFCRDGSRTVTSYLCTVAPEPPSGRPGALVLPSQVPFRTRTFCTGLMRAETVSRIGHPSGNLHRAGYTRRSCAGMASHLQDSR